MTDTERHGSVAAQLADRLLIYQRNRLTLFDWIHPGWLDAELFRAPGGASRGTHRRLARGVDAWLTTMGVRVPTLEAFRGEHALPGTLPLDAALGALRLRALFLRRAELRYWVDRESRERVVLWLGRHGSAALRWLIETPNAPALDRLMRDYDMPALDELDDLELAWEGYCLFANSGLCEAPMPAALLRFVWAQNAVAPPWVRAQEASVQREDSDKVIRRLNDFFGSDT
jgi:hypothetical protein